jgi:hypothetical protein
LQLARYVRLFEDEHGDSYFEDMDISLTPVDFAPPAAPLNLASLFAVTHCALVGAPVNWHGEQPHTAPRRQIHCTLKGEYQVTASDSTTRRFPPGSLLLLEDTDGKGHSTRVMGMDDLLMLVVAIDG